MPNPPRLDAEMEVARAAAEEAGAVVMAHFRRPEEVRFKAPGQPVTEADLAADRILRERLSAAFPDYGWLSEESAASRDRRVRSRVWVVDPIDGTNSFVERRPEFAVCVGLVEAGEPVLGVVHNPATGETYHAVRGGGAFRGRERIRVAPRRASGEAGTMLVSRSELGSGELIQYEEAWRFLPLGCTAYRMVKVADGTAHVFVSARPKSEWDVCAPALIVEEAGGSARRLDGGRLRFNQPVPVLDGVVATNGEDFSPLAAVARGDAAPGERRREG